jgi:hypothetical protein
MSKLGGWVGGHRIAAGFAAGALLTLFAVAVMGYLVLATSTPRPGSWQRRWRRPLPTTCTSTG